MQFVLSIVALVLLAACAPDRTKQDAQQVLRDVEEFSSGALEEVKVAGEIVVEKAKETKEDLEVRSGKIKEGAGLIKEGISY